jgi:hypothetical protein
MSETPEPSQFPADRAAVDPVAALEQLGALWSPSFDDYAAGRIGAESIVCALCERCPCACPPFGTPEYFALLDRRHGRR